MKIDKNTINKIASLSRIKLDDKEKKEFVNSIEAVKKLWEAASKIDTDLSK